MLPLTILLLALTALPHARAAPPPVYQLAVTPLPTSLTATILTAALPPPRNRQSTGTCPVFGHTCPLTNICCSSETCCPALLPFCSESETFCVNNQGISICEGGVLCIPCKAQNDAAVSNGLEGNSACRLGLACAAGPPFGCVLPDGYPAFNCNGFLGVSCGDGKCCRNPLRCLPDSNRCVSFSDPRLPDMTRNVEPTPSFSPGTVPVSGGTAPPPTTSVVTDAPTTTVVTDAPTTTVVTDAPTTTVVTDAPTTTVVTDAPTTTVVTDAPTTDAPTTTTVSTISEPGIGGPAEGNEEDSGSDSAGSSDNNGSSDSDPACFPATATVQRPNGEAVPMEQLRTGDRVLVAAGQYSEVFMWTHRDPAHSSSRYVTLQMHGAAKLTATEGHLLPVCRQALESCQRQVVQIETIAPGDAVWVVEGGVEMMRRVDARGVTAARGLYNPQTMHGDIVVDGVVSTCYTRAIPIAAAHSLLAPLRAMYEIVGVAIGKKIDLY